MPSVCWDLNNWIWGVMFYDRLQSALSNFIIANSPYDQCDGMSAVRVNTAPSIVMDPAWQITNENTPLLISKPIKVSPPDGLGDGATASLPCLNLKHSSPMISTS